MNFDAVTQTAAASEPELKRDGPSPHIGASGQAQMMRDPGVPAVGADQDSRSKGLRAPVCIETDPPTGFFPLQVLDSTALEDNDTFTLRFFNQDMIQRAAR